VGTANGLPAFSLGKYEVFCYKICEARLLERIMVVKEKMFLNQRGAYVPQRGKRDGVSPFRFFTIH
jgi:hypothetical protein